MDRGNTGRLACFKSSSFSLSGVLVVLGAMLQMSGAEDGVGSLDNVISPRDLAWLGQVLSAAEPYSSVREAYLIARGVMAGIPSKAVGVLAIWLCGVWC